MMGEKEITVAHVYILEGRSQVKHIFDILHKEKIMGATAIRAIAGYGRTDSGAVHTSSLLTLSLRLPLVVEFFGEPKQVQTVISKLRNQLKLRHIISWQAISHTTVPNNPLDE